MAEENVVIVRFTEWRGTRRPPVLSAVIVSGNVLGDLWDWVVGVFERIGDVSGYWLALPALKTAESAS